MRKNLYTAICQALSKIESLVWVDLGRRLAHTDEAPNCPLPAALIHFERVAWNSGTRGIQTGMLTLAIDVYVPDTETSYQANEARDYTLRWLRLIENVYSRIQDLSTDDVQGLQRRSEEPLQTARNVIGVRLRFESRIQDQSQARSFSKHSTKNFDAHGRLSH